MRDKLTEYVKHGPNAGTSIPEMVLGVCLHYVFWAMIVVVVLLVYIIPSLITTWNYPIEDLVRFGAIAGWIVAFIFTAFMNSQL